MVRGIRISTEFAFLLSGVFIMIVAWALNLIGVVSGDPSSGHGAGDIYLWLFLMLQGLPFPRWVSSEPITASSPRTRT